MLTELYRYALDHGLAAQPGFKPKRVCLLYTSQQHGVEGTFLGHGGGHMVSARSSSILQI